jgi:hypothetical protein
MKKILLLAMIFSVACGTTRRVPVVVPPPPKPPVDHVLNWPDRRPIGMAMLASVEGDYSTNNWKVKGYGQLTRKNLDYYANNCITNAFSIDAQGIIVWDIEGQRFPHPFSYIGDPAQLSFIAPEMDSIADDFFRKFKDAGLKVGICIRPDSIVWVGGWPNHFNTYNPEKILADKIHYAKSRWGCTLFYIDSNIGEGVAPGIENNIGYGRLLPYTIFQNLAKQFPDCLLIPEHQSGDYWKYTAPYNDKNFRHSIAEEKKTYPSAFQVLMIGEWNLTDAQLKESVQEGNILMGRLWYQSPELIQIKQAYATH